MTKKLNPVVTDKTNGATLPAEILPPEAGNQIELAEGAEPPAPAPADDPRDLSTDFLDDAGDTSANDPLPGPAPTPEQSGADVPASGVGLWRKKPVVIQAIQYTGNNLAAVFAFTGKHPKWDEWFASWGDYEAHVAKDRGAFKILTTEGTMEALPGDWIIRGTAGEHYPCKPEIFAEIYEPAEDTASQPTLTPEKPPLSEDLLRAGIAMIEERNHDLTREQLVKDLRADGAKVEDKVTHWLISWHGVKTTCTSGLSIGLNTWCSKARRAIMNGEAA